MNNDVNGGREDEKSLVKLYADLTGSGEGQGRSVFMYLLSDRESEPQDKVLAELGEACSREWWVKAGASAGRGDGESADEDWPHLVSPSTAGAA
jgi:hypothetical protein